MTRRICILPLVLVCTGLGCKSAPADTPTAAPGEDENPQLEQTYPEEGPPLRRCRDYDSVKGELCRLTPVGEAEVRLRVRFPNTTEVQSAEAIPAELIRFLFLGRLDGFAACTIPAAREGWTGEATTAIQATLVGSSFDHVTMAPDDLPELTSQCFVELTRRLRIKRAPGGEDARITQPVVVTVTPR